MHEALAAEATGAAAPQVEIRGGVKPAPPGVRLFDQYSVTRMTSVEPLRWDRQWDGVRIGDLDGWTPVFDCAALVDVLASDHPERLWVVGLTWLEIPTALRDSWPVFEFEPTSMPLETDDWDYSFELLAAGDWTGDGLEDVLVEFYDDGKIATYVAISALVLEAPTPGGPLIAHEGNELLRTLLLAERRPPSGEPERRSGATADDDDPPARR